MISFFGGGFRCVGIDGVFFSQLQATGEIVVTPAGKVNGKFEA